MRGVSDELVPAPSPILGQDLVELRIIDPNEPDVRRWNVLEFGEPEVLKQSALAVQLGQRASGFAAQANRAQEMKIDLFVEPVVAGLNIGGGVGFGRSRGEVARLAYNLITPKFIADVPKVKELRELSPCLPRRKNIRS